MSALNAVKSFLLVVALYFSLIGGVKSFEIGDRFLNYGNGMINLDRITHIKPKIDYYVTLSGEDSDELFTQYGTSDMSKESIDGVLSWFQADYLKHYDYYFLRIRGYITFDNFTLTMVDEKTFVKLPPNFKFEEQALSFRKNFVEFLNGLGEITNTVFYRTFEADKNPLIDPQYKKLKDMQRSLENISEFKIRQEVEGMASSYKKIVTSD